VTSPASWQAELDRCTEEALGQPVIPVAAAQRCLDLAVECDVTDNDAVWHAFNQLLRLTARLWAEQGPETGEAPVITAMDIAVRSYAATGDPLMVSALARRLVQHGIASYSVRLYEAAIALDVPPREGLRPTALARMDNNLGNLLRDLGELDAAEARLTRCVAAIDSGSATGDELELLSVALNNLALVYSGRGETAQARDTLIEALRIMETIGAGPVETAITLDNLAQQEIILGQRAGPLWLAGGEYVNMPTSEHFRTAEHYLDRAQQLLATRLPDANEDYAVSLVNSADLAAQWKDDDRYAEYSGRALDIVRQGNVTRETALLVMGLNGRHLVDSGQPEEAVSLLRPVFEDTAVTMASHELPSRFLTVLLEAAAQAGDRDLAERAGQLLAETDDENLARQLARAAESHAQDVFRAYGDRAELIIGHCLALAPDATAPAWVYDLLLNRKGILAERQGSAWLRAWADGGDQVAELLQQVRDLRAEAARVDLDGARTGTIQAARRAYDEAQLRLARAESQLNRVLGPRSEPPRRTLAEVQACLGDRTQLLDFTTSAGLDGQSRYIMFLIQGDGPVTFRDLGTCAELDGQLRAMQDALAVPPDGGPDTGTRAAALRDAAPELFRPDDSLQEHIVVAPTGLWGLIPPGMLPGPDGAPLIGRHQVDVVPSARWLVARTGTSLEEDPAETREAAVPEVLGDPDFDAGIPDDLPFFMSMRWSRLAHAGEEVREVAALLDTAPVTGADATRGRLLSVSGPRCLHLATHGWFLDAIGNQLEVREPRSSVMRSVAGVAVVEDPGEDFFGIEGTGSAPAGAELHRSRKEWLEDIGPRGQLSRSALLLAGFNTWLAGQPTEPGTGTGMISAGEFALLDLAGTELVVLSACQTGVGAVSYADGTLLGLRAAALAAGAACCVCSLWPVHDEQTTALMTAFYRRLGHGDPPGTALRTAQLDIRARHPDPYFWAGWVAEGAVT
jgi:tetratricopeptide (TPR) repeat protein